MWSLRVGHDWAEENGEKILFLNRSSGKEAGWLLPPTWSSYLVWNCFMYARISAWLHWTGVRWNQRMTGTPSGPTRNFSKFQLGCHGPWWVPRICLIEPINSEGWGQDCCSREMEKEMMESFLLMDDPGYFHPQILHFFLCWDMFISMILNIFSESQPC